jgi:hypothetical protein
VICLEKLREIPEEGNYGSFIILSRAFTAEIAEFAEKVYLVFSCALSMLGDEKVSRHFE